MLCIHPYAWCCFCGVCIRRASTPTSMNERWLPMRVTVQHKPSDWVLSIQASNRFLVVSSVSSCLFLCVRHETITWLGGEMRGEIPTKTYSNWLFDFGMYIFSTSVKPFFMKNRKSKTKERSNANVKSVCHRKYTPSMSLLQKSSDRKLFRCFETKTNWIYLGLSLDSKRVHDTKMHFFLFEFFLPATAV